MPSSWLKKILLLISLTFRTIKKQLPGRILKVDKLLDEIVPEAERVFFKILTNDRNNLKILCFALTRVNGLLQKELTG